MTKVEYIVDGEKFNTLDEFYDTVSRVLIPGAFWGRNLDAFNDILRGGFGTPEGGFVLRWKNSAVSRERLGYAETIRWLERRLAHCILENRRSFGERLDLARKETGSTLFDMLVGIVQDHCPGGVEEEDGVELILE